MRSVVETLFYAFLVESAIFIFSIVNTFFVVGIIYYRRILCDFDHIDGDPSNIQTSSIVKTILAIATIIYDICLLVDIGIFIFSKIF